MMSETIIYSIDLPFGMTCEILFVTHPTIEEGGSWFYWRVVDGNSPEDAILYNSETHQNRIFPTQRGALGNFKNYWNERVAKTKDEIEVLICRAYGGEE